MDASEWISPKKALPYPCGLHMLPALSPENQLRRAVMAVCVIYNMSNQGIILFKHVKQTQGEEHFNLLLRSDICSSFHLLFIISPQENRSQELLC